MRAGFAVSLIGHIGAVLMTLLAWETRSTMELPRIQIVPVEIVDLGAEPNVRALAQDAPEGEMDAADQPQEASLSPTPAPTPPRPRPQEQFDPSSARTLFEDTDRPTGQQPREGDRADQTRTSAGLGTEERTTLQARVNSMTVQELNRCWRTVADMEDPERLVVVVAFRLNRDGSLLGQPRVVRPANTTFDPQMGEAVRRAVSAVLICDQRMSFARIAEDPLVGEHYELWRDHEIEFGARIQ